MRTAVIHLNDPLGQKLARETTASRVLGYAIAPAPEGFQALVRAENLIDTPSGQRFTLIVPNGRVTVDTALVGRYNVENLLAVAAVLCDAGVSAEDIARRLNSLTPPPGRMERYGGDGQPLVVVDYAHTPDALENALRALRDVATQRRGRLCVVFGCGGDRDPGKRPEMGAIAARCADRVMVTSDNPRSEDPQAIIDAILSGVLHADSCLDRAEAISRSINDAAAADVILLAGKGHEDYQEIAGERRPFSDAALAQTLLKHWGTPLAQEDMT